MREESKIIRVSLEAYEALQRIQEEFAKDMGFVPSISQIIKYLVANEMKGKTNNVR